MRDGPAGIADRFPHCWSSRPVGAGGDLQVTVRGHRLDAENADRPPPAPGARRAVRETQIAPPQTRTALRRRALPDLTTMALRRQQVLLRTRAWTRHWPSPPDRGLSAPRVQPLSGAGLLRRLGLRPIRFHDLRHLSASPLVQARPGHARATTPRYRRLPPPGHRLAGRSGSG